MTARSAAVWCAEATPQRAPRPLLKSISRAKRSLGQNFLIDQAVLEDVVRVAQVERGDKLLEIGPGTGALTRCLASRGAQILAIEKDTLLCKRLQEEYSGSQGVEIIEGDILKADALSLVESLQNRAPETDAKIKVVANLPYNITTDVLKFLLPLGDSISRLSIMLQLEAAERLTRARPGDEDYRVMSVLTSFYATSSLVLHVDRRAFSPAPRVDSAVVIFDLKDAAHRLPVPSEKEFGRLLRVAFSSRRKLLRNNLCAVYDSSGVDAALEALNMTSIRPQSVNVEGYAALCRHICGQA